VLVREQSDRTTMVDLVRLTRTEPGLRAVWLEAHQHAEPAFAEALARRAGLPGPNLAVTTRSPRTKAAPKRDYEAAMREALMIAARTFSS
jgi:2-hydroxychromene-2-carboxylate isomerase